MPALAALQTSADINNRPTARIAHTTSITVRFGRRDSTDAGGPADCDAHGQKRLRLRAVRVLTVALPNESMARSARAPMCSDKSVCCEITTAKLRLLSARHLQLTNRPRRHR